MTNKKKLVIILLAVLLLAAAGYMLWGTPTALELFPETIWQSPHEQTVFYAERLFDAEQTDNLDEKKLQQALGEADLWRIPNPDRNYPGDPCILVCFSTEAGEYRLWVGANGYVMAIREENRELTDRIIPTPQELLEDFFGNRKNTDYRSTWYREDGSLYRALKELTDQTK